MTTRIIRQTDINEYMVSTIELLDWYDEFVFETMVFQTDVGYGGYCGDHPDYETRRFKSEDESLNYHDGLCALIISKMPDPDEPPNKEQG